MTITPYHVKISPSAFNKIKALTKKHQKMIIKVLQALSINPRPVVAHKIDGMTGLYCEHVHSFRLIYKIDEQEVLLLIVK